MAGPGRAKNVAVADGIALPPFEPRFDDGEPPGDNAIVLHWLLALQTA